MTEPLIGTEATAELTVGPGDLAITLTERPGDAFPAVFATARMIGLMELAGSRLLQPFAAPGELSVGVTVEVSHTAATPLGGRVTAVARYTGRRGKLFAFEVTARDEGGEIGKGTHQRAIVSADRLVSGAARRLTPLFGGPV